MNKVFFETCQLSPASRWNQLAVYDIMTSFSSKRRKLTCKRTKSSISMLDYVGLFHCSLKIVTWYFDVLARLALFRLPRAVLVQCRGSSGASCGNTSMMRCEICSKLFISIPIRNDDPQSLPVGVSCCFMLFPIFIDTNHPPDLEESFWSDKPSDCGS